MASIDMGTLFRECCHILDTRLVPIHYGTLTGLAVDNLANERPSDFYRLKEDVREKMRTKRSGVAYIGEPLCVCVKSRWFITNWLLNPDSDGGFTIPGSAECGVSAVVESVLRFPHMLTKTRANEYARVRGCAVGMVREKHVTRWFNNKYPNHWMPPDNEGKWTVPCDHDFKLRMSDRELKVDVAGRRSDGRFGQPYGGRKPGTDVHLLADIEGDSVVIYGAVRHLTSEGIMPVKSWPITNFLVWVNTDISGLDWKAIATEVGT